MDIKDIGAIAGIVVTLITLIKGLLEYKKQGAQKRAAYFLAMRKRLREDSVLKHIRKLLDNNDPPELASVPFENRRDFLGFFEEVAIGMNSKLIKHSVAHYMFGYYAILCWDSKYFWADINRNSPYWYAFKDFVDQMKKIDASRRRKCTRFRF